MRRLARSKKKGGFKIRKDGEGVLSQGTAAISREKPSGQKIGGRHKHQEGKGENPGKKRMKGGELNSQGSGKINRKLLTINCEL